MLSKHYCSYYSTRVAGAVREVGRGNTYLSLGPRKLVLGCSGKHKCLPESHICKEGKRKNY